jgi:hypothetical protein
MVAQFEYLFAMKKAGTSSPTINPDALMINAGFVFFVRKIKN